MKHKIYFDRDLEREFFTGDLDLLRFPRDLDRLRDFDRLRDDLKGAFVTFYLKIPRPPYTSHPRVM